MGLVIGAAIMCWAICYPVMAVLRRFGFWDQPNERSSHEMKTLRGGGGAPLLVMIWSVGLWAIPQNPILGSAWLGSLVVLGVVSLVDDKRHVPVGWRLVVQSVVAVLVVQILCPEHYSYYEVALISIVLVAFMNFVNFMDGINGLVAGMVALLAVGVALLYSGNEVGIPIMAWVIAGAALGFLPYNFPKAKMFLGDVGSITMGFSVGVLLIWACIDLGRGNAKELFILAVLPFYFFAEGTVAVIRRFQAGKPITRPHREHFYQRLIRAGWSHAKVSGVIWAVQIFMMGVMLSVADYAKPAGIGLFCVLVWGGLFGYAEHVYRNAAPPKDIDES